MLLKDTSSIRAPCKFIEPDILSFSIFTLLLFLIASSLVSFFTIGGWLIEGAIEFCSTLFLHFDYFFDQ